MFDNFVQLHVHDIQHRPIALRDADDAVVHLQAFIEIGGTTRHNGIDFGVAIF